MKNDQKICTSLWYDTQAEEAANFYISLFPDSHIGTVTRYPKGGPAGEGKVMTVTFYLAGIEYIAINAGPHFKFNESISLFVKCDTQEEIDRLWEKLTADGGQESQCGWLKDKYGLSWQIAPAHLERSVGSPDREKAARAMQKMMTMKKLNIAEMENA